MEFVHKSIMLEEVIESLAIKPNGIYVDGTLGGAGHSFEIATNLKNTGTLIGIDRDEEAIKKAKDTIYKNVENNIYGDRIQDLPTVKEVNIENIKKQEKNNVTYYIVLANILYEKEMGYPTKIRLTLTYGEQTDLSNNHLEITKIEEISE